MSAAAGTERAAAVSWRDVVVAEGHRVVDPATGCTRADLLHFGAQAAPWLLPHLAGRAVSLRRGPTSAPAPLDVHQAAPGELLGVARRRLDDGETALEIACDEGLLHALQHGCVEFRTGHGRIDPPQLPDRLVFTLQPQHEAGWQEVAEAATRVRHSFHELGLSCCVKTDGRQGLDLIVPLEPGWTWPVLGSAAEALAAHAGAQWPTQVALGAQGRAARIDWRANTRAARVTAAYSPVAEAGLAVSVPLRWGELAHVDSATHWNVFSLPHRLLALQGSDPWAMPACSPHALRYALTALGFPVDMRPV